MRNINKRSFTKGFQNEGEEIVASVPKVFSCRHMPVGTGASHLNLRHIAHNDFYIKRIKTNQTNKH